MKILLRTIVAVSLGCIGALAIHAEQIEENFQPYLTYKPDPVVPAVALRQGWGGTGTYQLSINPKNGEVEEVKVLRRTGYPQLDAEMVMTLFKWRFKPRTVTKVRLSYEIGVLGRARGYHTGRY